ncbi:PHD finger-like domain-containing 5A [Labeo rohita]|uniref:PHD finger-like domain-containing 5A n=1 Tax=Labeo rohita TaxID=84645 RepID=A0A498L8L0_LABRO|nr:PHD finger-like domain-containing 5A [Labeo rohita]RXN11202.1 PHD finger-like domain-containing 5A [Labeo rohita]
MGLTKGAASPAEVLEYLTLTTAKSAPSRRKTKQAGVGDGKCVICDSYVRPCTLVRICDECNYGSYQGRCVICGGPGVSDAYYCKECTIQEKDRDGCPKIVNLGSSKTDLFYERKKYGFKKR